MKKSLIRWVPILLTFYLFPLTSTSAQPVSVAGLFPLEGSGRIVYNFNEGWRFLLGDAEGAEATAFDDAHWEVVCAPHIDRLEPSEASGGRNYQGVCWYRKHFTVPEDMAGKQVLVHFEAIMGKQWVYVNGRLVKEHLGGYLPVTIDLSAEGVKAGDKCVIAVKADNSDDKNYPPARSSRNSTSPIMAACTVTYGSSASLPLPSPMPSSVVRWLEAVSSSTSTTYLRKAPTCLWM